MQRESSIINLNKTQFNKNLTKPILNPYKTSLKSSQTSLI